MLGGLAQAEVDEHVKEYNHGSIKVKPKHTPLQQFTANSPLLPAMSLNQNHLKNGNSNDNSFNNNQNNNNYNSNFNSNAANQKFISNGNGKNRNVRDSLTDNTGFNGDFSSWNGGQTNNNSNKNNNNNIIKSPTSNNGKQTVQSVAKELISNASNLEPGQYIVRPVKKTQPKNSIFPYLFKRSSQELMTNLKPPPVVQKTT
jgi:hypothetical protein